MVTNPEYTTQHSDTFVIQLVSHHSVYIQWEPPQQIDWRKKNFKYFDKICDVLHLIPVFKFYSLQTHVSIIKAENKNSLCGDYKVFSQ